MDTVDPEVLDVDGPVSGLEDEVVEEEEDNDKKEGGVETIEEEGPRAHPVVEDVGSGLDQTEDREGSVEEDLTPVEEVVREVRPGP